MDIRFKLIKEEKGPDGNPKQTTYSIEEPIGFDGFTTKLSRNNLHGISAQHSVGSLEFYGVAAYWVKKAYQGEGIEANLALLVERGETELYRGKLDMTSYKESNKEYFSVSCDVGDIGVMTTFYNRYDTPVFMDNKCKTIGGKEMRKYENLEKKIILPSKGLPQTLKAVTTKEKSYIKTLEGSRREGTGYLHTIDLVKEAAPQKYYITVDIPFEKISVNEVGEFKGTFPEELNIKSSRNDFPEGTPIAYFQRGSIAGDLVRVEGKISFLCTYLYGANPNTAGNPGKYRIYCYLSNDEGDKIPLGSPTGYLKEEEIPGVKYEDAYPNGESGSDDRNSGRRPSTVAGREPSRERQPQGSYYSKSDSPEFNIIFSEKIAQSSNYYLTLNFCFEYSADYNVERLSSSYINIKNIRFLPVTDTNEEVYVSFIPVNKIANTETKVALIHEVLSHITESLTDNEVTVQSDWYGRPDSEVYKDPESLPSLSPPRSKTKSKYYPDGEEYFEYEEIEEEDTSTPPTTESKPPLNPPPSEYGGGSFKSITTGLNIRNASLVNGNMVRYSVTLKSLIDSLAAMDNIGMGFSEESCYVEENGEIKTVIKPFLRVEPWYWFYKDNCLLEIKSPADIQRKIDTSEIFSALKIGYNKYIEVNDVNCMDVFMTKREYSTRLTIINNTKEVISSLIADPYALESTRRLFFDKDVKDWKYDNDLFVICLALVPVSNRTDQLMYAVDQGIVDSDNTTLSPESLYNVRISPARMARRWIQSVLHPKKNSSGESLIPTLVEGNYLAQGNSNQGGKNIYGDDFYVPKTGIKEGEEIPLGDLRFPLLQPELITFDYPVSFQSYTHIKKNPYGYIKVDDEICFIKEMQYKFSSGMAQFTLIPAQRP